MTTRHFIRIPTQQDHKYPSISQGHIKQHQAKQCNQHGQTEASLFLLIQERVSPPPACLNCQLGRKRRLSLGIMNSCKPWNKHRCRMMCNAQSKRPRLVTRHQTIPPKVNLRIQRCSAHNGHSFGNTMRIKIKQTAPLTPFLHGRLAHPQPMHRAHLTQLHHSCDQASSTHCRAEATSAAEGRAAGSDARHACAMRHIRSWMRAACSPSSASPPSGPHRPHPAHPS